MELINNSPKIRLTIYHGAYFMGGETWRDGVVVKSCTYKYNMNTESGKIKEL